jgi:hypothetical protein
LCPTLQLRPERGGAIVVGVEHNQNSATARKLARDQVDLCGKARLLNQQTSIATYHRLGDDHGGRSFSVCDAMNEDRNGRLVTTPLDDATDPDDAMPRHR